jgi:hypothetical protein
MARGDFAVAAFEAGANENDAGVCVGRAESQRRRLSGMNADAGHTDGQPERGLPAKFHPNVACF